MSIDLKPADKDAVSALAKLRNNQDFISFQMWIGKCLVNQREKNDRLTDDQLKWSQGQCQAMQKILDSPELAVKILKTSR